MGSNLKGGGTREEREREGEEGEREREGERLRLRSTLLSREVKGVLK